MIDINIVLVIINFFIIVFVVENIVVIIDVYMGIKIDVNLLDIYMWMFIIFLVSGFFYFIIDFISEFI